MKSMILALISAFAFQAWALGDEDIRCMIDPKGTIEEGSQFYINYLITLDLKDRTKISEVRVDFLAENGFYGNFPIAFRDGEFKEGEYLQATLIQEGADETPIEYFVKAIYDSEKGNYKAKVDAPEDRVWDVTCMKYVGL